MSGTWLISYFALWLLVIFLFLAVFALARQIGLLHRRLGLPSARMENAGPEIGEIVPEIRLTDLDGREVGLGSERGKQTLLAFISATCTTCDEMAPALRSIWKSERRTLDVILVSLDGDEKANRGFVARHNLNGITYIASPELSAEYHVSSPPYALLVNKDREVVAKGVANHLEHLESLLNAAKLGYPSIDTYERYNARSATLPDAVS